MKKYLSFIFLLTSLMYAQEQSQNYLVQLNATYTTGLDAIHGFTADTSIDWNNRISIIKKGIDQFSSAEKNKIEDALKSIEKTIESYIPKTVSTVEKSYMSAKDSMDQLLAQYKGTALPRSVEYQLETLLSSAKKDIAKEIISTTFAIISAIESPLKSVEKTYQTISRTVIISQLTEQEKQRQEKAKKMRALVGLIMELLPQLEQANIDSRKTIFSYLQTGNLDLKKIQSISEQYKTLLSKLSKAYTDQGFPIDISDSANYVVVVINKLMNLYFEDIAATIKRAKEIAQQAMRKHTGKGEEYYKLFADLAERLQGSKQQDVPPIIAQGYKNVIAEQAKAYFGAGAKEVTDDFAQKKLQMSMDAFGNALLDLSITMTEPTPENLVQAYAIYTELLSDSPLLKDKAKNNLVQRVNTYMAVLYVNRVQFTLKQMRLDKDTAEQLATIIDAYQKASAYYKAAGDAANASLYDNLAQMLTAAKKLRLQAEAAQKVNNITSAIDLYTQAFSKFQQGGDAIDAQQVSEKKNQLIADQQLAQAKKELSDFVTQYKAQMQSYMAFISTTTKDPNLSLATYEALLTALTQATQNAFKAYNKVILSYKELKKDFSTLQKAVMVLEGMANGLDQISTGDRFAALASLDGLNQAQAKYAQAVNELKKADAAFNQDVAEYVLVYPTQMANDNLSQLLQQNQKWNLQVLAERHIAIQYIEVANTLSDQVLVATQYYVDADGSRRVYLSQEVDTFLTATLDSISTLTKQIDTMYQSAQQAETAALQLTAADWQPKETLQIYQSVANAAWRDVLRQYESLMKLGKQEARVDYLRSVAAYADGYKANVPKEFYPNIGAALIKYRQYVLYAKANETTDQATALKVIESDVMPYFEQAQQLVKDIENSDLLSSATDNLKKLNYWLLQFNQALDEQQAIMTSLAPTVDPSGLTLFAKDVNEQTGVIQCSLKPAGQAAVITVALSDPEQKEADLYKTIADNAFANEDYRTAYQSYSAAQDAYQKLKQSDNAQQAKDKGNLAYTRFLVDSYLSLVIPNEKDQHGIGTITVAGIKVPEHYELYNYLIQLPSSFPLPPNLQTLAENPTPKEIEQVMDILERYAYVLYADQMLKENNIQFNQVFTEQLALRPLSAIPADIKSTAVDIIARANAFKAQLDERLTKKQSRLSLSARKAPDGSNLYSLSIFYQPTFGVMPLTTSVPPMTGLPYQQFPVAGGPVGSYYGYYGWAQKLANPNVETVQYGTKTLISANQPEIYNQLNDLQSQAYLSAGAFQKKRVDYLLNGGDPTTIDPTMGPKELALLQAARKQIEQLKKIKKDDLSVNLSDYIDSWQLIKSYLATIALTYYSAAAQFYTGQSEKLQAFRKLMSDTYVQLGDIAQLFLVGSPQVADYFAGSNGTWTGVLADLQNYYAAAFGLIPDRFDELEQKIAQPFVDAGDLLIDQKNYFGSLRYYKIAVAALRSMKKIDQQKLASASLKLLKAQFDGSTNHILSFRQAMIKPLDITLSTGSKETISLDDLTAKSCPPPPADKAECTVYEKLRTDFLDSLIYYQDAQGWANVLSTPPGTQQPQTQKEKDAINKAAADLVSTYTSDQKMSLDTLASVTAMMKRSDFEQVINGAFDQFSNKVLKATNDNDRAIGYEAISKWVNTLFFAFGKVYIYHFLGQDTTTKLPEFIKAIGAEKQGIEAPPNEWLGDQ